MGDLVVNLNADVFLVCVSQALSTESEEVMGLLVGETVIQVHGMMCGIFFVVLFLRFIETNERHEMYRC